MSLLRCAQQARISTLRLAARQPALNFGKTLARKYQSPIIRFTSTNTSTAASSSPLPITRKPIYPARLLVYHAGTGRTAFIGCLKVTTIFLFAFFGLVVAPAQLAAPTLPYWRFATTILTGLLPILFVTFTTAPFVTYIHLRLPPFARNSRDLLVRYLKTLPKTGEVDITTITLIGRPRVQRLQLADLKAVEPKILNVANFKTDKIDPTRPWWAGKGQRSYAIGQGKKSVKIGWAWDEVAEAIKLGRLRGASAVAGVKPSVGVKAAVKTGIAKSTPAAPKK